MYAFNINGDHFEICLMVVELIFVIYQMTPYIKAGKSKNHFAPCHHFTQLSSKHLEVFLLEPYQFIFEKSFHFFEEIVFEVDEICYN